MTALPLPVAALAAGLISFVSPCVLPLVPGYISLISGAGAEELRRPDARLTRSVLVSAILFIVGFTLVFVALGAAASGVGRLVQEHFAVLSQLAGALIVVFGLHKTGLMPMSLLNRETRIRDLPRAASAPRAFLVGFAFGFGWTPCVGPILTVILTFAASEATIRKGMTLLALYSAGLAVPFLLTALGIERFLLVYRRFRPHLHSIEVVSGALMIAAGTLIFTRHFSILNAWMSHIPLLSYIQQRFL